MLMVTKTIYNIKFTYILVTSGGFRNFFFVRAQEGGGVIKKLEYIDITKKKKKK